MTTPITTIEEIILSHDVRGMRHLAPHLPAGYATQAAQFILDKPGRVMIATGFYILSAGVIETDGPPGAIAIGNALDKLGYDVSYVTDEYCVEAIRLIDDASHEIIEFPIANHHDSAVFANETLAASRPDFLIAIERCGISEDGIYRNMRAADVTQFTAKIDHLFDQHPYSVGIGDGGNEIGMGNLKDIVAETEGLPDLPTVTTTTQLMCAAVSNWGGYGLVAALSVLSGKSLLPSVDQENEWIEKLVAAGAVDGFSGEVKLYVDGFTLEENSRCLKALHELMSEQGL